MQEYLINSLFLFIPYIAAGVVILLLLHVIKNLILKNIEDEKVKKQLCVVVNAITQLVWVIVLISIFYSSSNTYKNETFDKSADIYKLEQIQQQEHEESKAVIQDNTKKIEANTSKSFDELVKYK